MKQIFVKDLRKDDGIIDFFLDPFRQYKDEALRER